MNERFEYLTIKYLENELDDNEKTEFEKYLALQDNREYLSNAKFVDTLLEEYFLIMLTEEEINKIPGLREREELE